MFKKTWSLIVILLLLDLFVLSHFPYVDTSTFPPLSSVKTLRIKVVKNNKNRAESSAVATATWRIWEFARSAPPGGTTEKTLPGQGVASSSSAQGHFRVSIRMRDAKCEADIVELQEQRLNCWRVSGTWLFSVRVRSSLWPELWGSPTDQSLFPQKKNCNTLMETLNVAHHSSERNKLPSFPASCSIEVRIIKS